MVIEITGELLYNKTYSEKGADLNRYRVRR